jgi:hypothetical protein
MPTRIRVAHLAALAVVLLGTAVPAHAQFGIGGRFAMVKTDVDVDDDSQGFTGGHIRAHLSPRTAIEVSLDVHSETTDLVKVRDYPIQASLLLYPIRTTFAPYVLGGGGWYTRRLETLNDDRDVIDSVQTRDFGWHAGFGAELKLGRHAGVHADYRYTFLDFGSDDDEETDAGATAARERHSIPLVGALLPSYKGSMWTVGLTVYF